MRSWMRWPRRGTYWVDGMDDSLRELYQEVILDHSRHPRHFGALEDATHTGEGHNPLCGDRVKIYLSIDKDERIADIKFEGKGCAISQASASLMTDMLMGRTLAEAEKLMGGFLHLVKGEEVGEDLNDDDRERLDVMAGVSAFPMRVKCATLAWHTMKSALEGGETAKSE
jgi:nitrogen fixation NifU-like protein